jgi:hypothetical protein
MRLCRARLHRRWLVYITVVVAACAASAPFLHLGQRAQSLCERWGGSWASTRFTCITRSCFESHTCGTRYCPACYCKNLKPGASIAKVYVHLGEPSVAHDRELVWPSGAGDPGHVVARIANGHLESIDCAVRERP